MNDIDTTSRKPLISKETVVPLGIVIAVIGVAVLSAWDVASALSKSTADSEHRLERIEFKMEAIQQSIEAIDSNRYSRQELQMWAELLRAKNPTLDVPPLPN
jgi:hypothetical protein